MLSNESALSFPALSSASKVTFSTQGQTSRWSNTGLSPNGCAVIVVPSTEEDIISLVKFAAGNNLKVLPTAGKHGSFLPIDERCIYLDLEMFDTVELVKDLGCVNIGGGVVAGRMCSALAEQGWYTSRPNSNAVGMVGYVLGGGSSALNGMHSLAIDNLLAVRILTTSGTFLTLSPNSLGDEKDLYNVICGAGFGFGVVTSITLKAWRISDLGLTDGKVWTHRMIFPPSDIDTAAELFVHLSDPSPHMSTALLALRAPPSAPHPGAPVLMLILTYFGPASSAEKAFGAAFSPAYVTKATLCNTALANLADLNGATDVLNSHGDYKTNYSTWAHNITKQKIRAGFEHWVRLGEEIPDAKAASYFVVSARDPTAMRAHDRDNEKFFPRTIRERAIFAQAVPWWKDSKNENACRKWGRDMLGILGDRSRDKERVNGFGANLNSDVDVTEIWPQEKLEQIRRQKGIWDPGNVFWNPVVDGDVSSRDHNQYDKARTRF